MTKLPIYLFIFLIIKRPLDVMITISHGMLVLILDAEFRTNNIDLV